MSSSNRKIISTAPGRAGIIGNPTDMYGGAVLSCSIRECAKVTITPHSTLTLSTGDEQFEILNKQDLELRGDHFDIARSIFQYLGHPKESYRVEFESRVPFRSGLSGSTALLVALLQGILAQQKNILTNIAWQRWPGASSLIILRLSAGFKMLTCVFSAV